MKKWLSKLCFKLGKHFGKAHHVSDINLGILFHTAAIKLGYEDARFYLLDLVLEPTKNLPKAPGCLDRDYFWFKTNPEAALELMWPLIKNGTDVQRTEAKLAIADVVVTENIYKTNKELCTQAFALAKEAYKEAPIIHKNGQEQTWHGACIVDRATNALGNYYARGIGTEKDKVRAEELFKEGADAGGWCCQRSLNKLLEEKSGSAN